MQKVQIPRELIKVLEPFGGCCFLKVSQPMPENPDAPIPGNGKKAIERGWVNHLYKADDPSLQEWLAGGGNYGVCAGDGLIMLEHDTAETQVPLEVAGIATFRVKSGRASAAGCHDYFRSNVSDNGEILDADGKNVAHIQVNRRYVVGPNCNHKSGGTYQIISDFPIQWITRETLEEIYGLYDKTANKAGIRWSAKIREEIAEDTENFKKRIQTNLHIRDLVDVKQMKHLGNGEYQGVQPTHGSSTGGNFTVNVLKNTWYCFRCGSGGSPLHLLAVLHGIIECGDSKPDVLKGGLFRRTVELAQTHGYNVEFPKLCGEVDDEVAEFFEGNPPHFVPSILGEKLMEAATFVTRESDRTMYRYDKTRGIYVDDGESYAMREMQKTLGKELRIARQNEVLNYIRCATFSKCEPPVQNVIALKNELYNFDTMSIEKFTPEYFIVNALPITYDEKAECPLINKFFSEIVTEEDIITLLQLFAWCLQSHYKIQGAVMLTGSGRNGKTTFLGLMTHFLGKNNCSSVPLQDMESSFSRGCLFGKLANIKADLSDRAVKETGAFKAATGGEDLLDGEKKYCPKFFFVNTAKFIFAANKVPMSADDSDAYFRRWLIIDFPNKFERNSPKCDPNMLYKLKTESELSGLFNLVVKQYKILEEQLKFSHNKSTEEAREHYIRASNPALSFVENCIDRIDDEILISQENVYIAFAEFCNKHKLITSSKRELNARIEETLLGIRKEVKIENKMRVTYWRGIRLTVNEYFNGKNQAIKSKSKKENKELTDMNTFLGEQ